MQPDAVIGLPAAATKEIQVWICPRVECANFYGASSDVDLVAALTGPKTENRAALKESSGSPWAHNRAACPDCRARGLQVQRVLTTVRVLVPEEVPTPPLPAA